MENSALNKAHKLQRRVVALVQEGRFEEAAKCHETVANLLTEAYAQVEASFLDVRNSTLSSQNSPTLPRSTHALVTLESIALQRDYHKRQVAVTRMKQAQYEEYKAKLPKPNDKKSSTDSTSDKTDSSLRQVIYGMIEEQDSLLSLILLLDNKEKAFKHPKDMGPVIDELRAVNSQLRHLVGNLLSQLEAKEEEVRQLTEKLEAVSVSPGDEIRMDGAHHLRLAPLPPLTPLEMPSFDFTSL